MSRRHPVSTLFPYTTLFRSIAERRVRQWSKLGAPVEFLSREQTKAMLGSDAWYGGFWNRTGGHINPLALSRGLAARVLDRDRKSTRLNSSHQIISYAVFCLK